MSVHDIRIGDETDAFLVEPTGGGAGSGIVFLHWFYIAAMTGLEFRRAAAEPNELHAYEIDHAMRDPQGRADRAAFLSGALGWTNG